MLVVPGRLDLSLPGTADSTPLPTHIFCFLLRYNIWAGTAVSLVAGLWREPWNYIPRIIQVLPPTPPHGYGINLGIFSSAPWSHRRVVRRGGLLTFSSAFSLRSIQKIGPPTQNSHAVTEPGRSLTLSHVVEGSVVLYIFLYHCTSARESL